MFFSLLITWPLLSVALSSRPGCHSSHSELLVVIFLMYLSFLFLLKSIMAVSDLITPASLFCIQTCVYSASCSTSRSGHWRACQCRPAAWLIHWTVVPRLSHGHESLCPFLLERLGFGPAELRAGHWLRPPLLIQRCDHEGGLTAQTGTIRQDYRLLAQQMSWCGKAPHFINTRRGR